MTKFVAILALLLSSCNVLSKGDPANYICTQAEFERAKSETMWCIQELRRISYYCEAEALARICKFRGDIENQK